MEIPVISTGNRVNQGPAHILWFIATFTFEGNAKFHLEVGENKDTFFTSNFTDSLNSIHTPQVQKSSWKQPRYLRVIIPLEDKNL